VLLQDSEEYKVEVRQIAQIAYVTEQRGMNGECEEVREMKNSIKLECGGWENTEIKEKRCIGIKKLDLVKRIRD
jgi:hypothetical protein